MATTKKTTTPKKSTVKLTKERVITIYMEYVLEHETTPKTVYKFCKENKMTEEQFYQFFGSFEGVQQEIWNTFYQKSIDLMHKSPEVEQFGSREKLLTFYFTFFEMLTANRSYVLFMLKEHREPLKNLSQLKGLRKKIISFVKGLIEEDNKDKNVKLLQRNERIFSESVYLCFTFVIVK